MENESRVLFSITEQVWEEYVDNSCIHHQVGEESDEYIRGYIRGVQVALVDLLKYVKLSSKLRDDVGEIERRIWEADRIRKGEESAE